MLKIDGLELTFNNERISDLQSTDIEISNITNELVNADIELKTNNHDVELNDFTQGILKETIYAIVNSLKIDSQIKKINIKVEE